MAFWGNIAGTVTGYLRLGLSGVRLKNDAGVLAVRNAGDTADAKIQIADGTAANHAVSKGQLDTKAALAGSASQSFSMLNGTVAGTLSLTGAASTLGYGTGAGGAVTQATSKSTAVTLNKPCGRVTMNAEALAAGASVTFSVSSTLVASTDTVLLSSPAFGLSYRLECASVASGLFYVRVTNITGGSLSEAVVINFAIIKGATS